MDRVDEGTEYAKNVEILRNMLLNNDEFEAHAKRKIKALEQGGEYNKIDLNPVLTAKVAEVIR